MGGVSLVNEELEARMPKAWIYSSGGQLRLCGWRPSFFAPIAGVRWEAGWYGDGSACCPNEGARNRLGHERSERTQSTEFVSPAR